jgi:hypothetical protein
MRDVVEWIIIRKLECPEGFSLLVISTVSVISHALPLVMMVGEWIVAE